VRIAKRLLAAQPAVAQMAGDALDHADLKSLGGIEARQDAGQALRQHRLSGPGRADHQQIVAPSGGHLKSALGDLLAEHILEVAEAAIAAGNTPATGAKAPPSPSSPSAA